MVGVVSGNNFGLQNSSAGTLGQQGVFGNAAQGTTKEGIYLNVSNGNLVLQDMDDFVVGHGPDLAFIRTYNSQGTVDDKNGANWKNGMVRRVNGLTGTVNTAGSTVTRTAGDGSTSVFTWEAARAAYVTTEGGDSFQIITYNATSKEWTWKSDRNDLAGLHEVYDFNNNGRLVYVRDELNTTATTATATSGAIAPTGGNRYTYKYDTQGRLAEIIGGDQTFFDYDAQGRLSQIRVKLETSTWVRSRYEYDGLNRLETVTTDLTPYITTADLTAATNTADGKTYATRYTYDGATSRIASVTQADGTSQTFTYENGKVKTATDALGNKITLDYSVFGTTKVTDPLGFVTDYSYDAKGQLTSVKGPEVGGVRQTTTFVYDPANGNLTSMTDARGTTAYAYDPNGNRVLERDPAGNTIARTYKINLNLALASSNLLQNETYYAVADPDREGAAPPTVPMTTRYVYDSANRLRFVVTHEGRVTEYRYSNAGLENVTLRYNGSFYTLAAGMAVTATLDEATMATWVNSASVDRNKVSMQETLYHDGRGQANFRGNVQSLTSTGVVYDDIKMYTIDHRGQLLRSLGYYEELWSYDGMGRVTSSTDAAGVKSTYAYDGLNTVVITSTANSTSTTQSYDAAGRLIATIVNYDGKASAIKNIYDANGNLRAVRNAAGEVTHWLYDAAGRKIAQIEANGALTEYIYNNAGQLAKTTRYATLISATGLLDGNDVPQQVALSTLRPAVPDADDRSTWNGYDLAGRMVATVDANGYLARLTYDGASRLVQTTYRARPVDTSLIVGLTIPATFTGEANVDEDRFSRLLYDRDGRLVGQLDAFGYLTENRYNAGGQLIEKVAYFDVSPLAARAAGDLAALRPATNPNSNIRERFIYNSLDKLVASIDGDNFLTEYSYDRFNNVTRQRRYANPVTAPAGLTIDTIGKTISAEDRITDFTYTSTNQLLRKTEMLGTAGDSGWTEYKYDNAGNVLSTTHGKATLAEHAVNARYDGVGRVIEELDEEGSRKLAALLLRVPAAEVAEVSQLWAANAMRYSYNTAGQRTSMTDVSGNRTLYFYDSMGRQAITMNALGEIQEQRYDSFGNVAKTIRYGNRYPADQLAALSGGAITAELRAVIAAREDGGRDQVAVFYYDDLGRLTYSVDGAGGVKATNYNAFGQVSQSISYSTGAYTRTLSGGGASAGQAALKTILAQATGTERTLFYYDVKGRLRYSVNALGEVQGQTYDQFDRVTQQTQYVTRYATPGTLTGAATEMTLLATANTSNSVQGYSYNKRGLVIDYTDAKTNHTLTDYTSFGEVTKRTTLATAASVAKSPLDSVTETLYDTRGRITLTMDSLGAVTSYAYDSDGRVILQRRYALPFVSTAEPNIKAFLAADKLSQLTDGINRNDSLQRFVYDVRGRLVATLTAIDSARVDAPTVNWLVTRITYDEQDRLVERVTFATSMRTDNEAPTNASILAWIAPPEGMPSNRAFDDSVVRMEYDAAGRLIASATSQLHAASGGESWSVVQNEYDGNNNLTVRKEFATSLLAANPTRAQMLGMADGASDRVTRYNYDLMGRVTATASKLSSNVTGQQQWAVTTLGYNAAGQLIRSVQHANAITDGLQADDLARNLVRDADRDRATLFSYDAAKRLEFTIDAAGGVVRQLYDAKGNATQTRAYAKATMQWESVPAAFEPATDAADRVSSTYYDPNGRPVYLIDAAGGFTEQRYDAIGNLIGTIRSEVVLDTAKLATLKPNSLLNEVALLKPAVSTGDRTERFVYDQNGRLRFTFDGNGYFKETRYNTLGQITSRIAYLDPKVFTDATQTLAAAEAEARAQTLAVPTKARAETYSYDQQGNLRTVTDALNFSESYTYDALGRKTTFTNKLSRVWRYSYDHLGRMLTEIGPITSNGFTYDALGNMTERREAYNLGARVTTYGYDVLGRQISITQPAVPIYDAANDSLLIDNASRYETDSRDRTTTVTYNALGDAVSNQDVGKKVSYKVYDKAGRVRFDVDALGNVTGYERDAYGAVIALTRYANPPELGGATPMQLNAETFRRAMRPNADLDRTIRTAYDAAGRVVKVSEPLTTVYDPHSIVAVTYLKAGKTTAIDYNGFGDVVSQSVYGADASGAAVTEAAVTRYYYDLRGNRSAKVDILSDATSKKVGYLSTYVYSHNGDLLAQTEYATEIATADRLTVGPGAANVKNRTIGYAYDELNRRVTEMRYAVEYSTSAAPGVQISDNLSTTYTYDKLGNQVSITDALNGITYSYYDAEGRVRALIHTQGALPAGVALAKSTLTEFELDAFGNITRRTDFDDEVTGISSAGYDVTQAMRDNSKNRVSRNNYDTSGRLLQSWDAEDVAKNRDGTRYSYDIYGRVAKQWRGVTSGSVTQIAYQVTRYDALGRAVAVETPGNVDVISGSPVANTIKGTKYNAFGEATDTTLTIGTDTTATIASTSYDQAGRAWRSNAGDGVYKITLFDALGQATQSIRSLNTDAEATATKLRGLKEAGEVLAMSDLQRTEMRYNMLGQMVDSRLVGDDRLQMLERGPNGWSVVQQAQGTLRADALVAVAVNEPNSNIVTVQYRASGSTTWLPAGDRLQRYDSFRAFSSAGLAAGGYEFQVFSQVPGGPAPTVPLESGTLLIGANADGEKQKLAIKLWLLVLNRVPDMAAINNIVDLFNRGYTPAYVIGSLMQSTEGAQRFTGTASDLIGRTLRETFGMSTSDPAYQSAVARHAVSYAASIGTGTTDSRAIVLADMVLIQNMLDAIPPASLAVRADALYEYVVAQRGGDSATSVELLALASSAPSLAVATAAQRGSLERNQLQVIRIYLSLFGRAPDSAGLKYWTDAMQLSGIPAETVVNGMLTSAEGQLPWLYPSAGLTPALYNQQLITRAYSMMLGRAPSAPELAAWTAKMTGPAAISKEQFVIQFSNQVTGFSGTDTVQKADRDLFNNKIAISYTAAVKLGMQLDAEASTQLVAGATSAATAQDAAAKAQLAATAAALAAKTSLTAADVAAGALPLEEAQRLFTRLYIGLMQRAPTPTDMADQLRTRPVGSAGWIAATGSILDATESKNRAGDWSAMSAEQFVQTLYRTALGELPTGAAGQLEMADYVAQLNAGKSQADVAYQFLNTPLNRQALTDADLALRSRFNNRIAVALTIGQSSLASNIAAQSEAYNLVTASDISAALNRAYDLAKPNVDALLLNAQNAAKTGQALAEAANKAATANAAALTAVTALGTKATAPVRLQLAQVYAALFGYTAASLPPLVDINSQVANIATVPLATVVQNMINGPRGFALVLSHIGFVEAVFERVLGAPNLATPAQLTMFTDQLVQGKSWGQVAVNILNDVIAYTNGFPDNKAYTFLQARILLDQNIYNVADALDKAVVAEAARLTALLPSLKSTADALNAQLPALLTAKTNAETARTTAITSANTAMANANAPGDAKGTLRAQIIRMYATLLQRSIPQMLVNEIENWLPSPSLASIARDIIYSAEARTIFPPTDSDADFIDKLFLNVLGPRERTTAEKAVYLKILSDNAGNYNARGMAAVAMIDYQTQYKDIDPVSVAYKKSVDTRITGLLALLKTESQQLATAANANIALATSMLAAITAKQQEKTRVEGLVPATLAAAADGTRFLALGNVHDVVQLYAAIRGEADYSGVLYWMDAYDRDAISLSGIADAIISYDFPGDDASFVRGLFPHILGREASEFEVSQCGVLLQTYSRGSLAFGLLTTTDSRAHHAPLTATLQATLTAKANADIAAKAQAEANVVAATAALTKAQADYAALGVTPATAPAVAAAAKKVQDSFAALSAAYTSVLTADDKSVAAAPARMAHETKLAEWTVADGNYKAAQAALLVNQTAAGAGVAIKAAAKAYVDAAVLQEAAAKYARENPLAVQSQQIVSLYTTLLARMPDAGELAYCTNLLNGRTLTDVAAYLMSTADGMTRYPATLSNADYITKLYTNGLARGFAADPGGLKFWTDQLAAGMSRQEAAVRLVAMIGATGSSDTLTLNNKALVGLKAIGLVVLAKADVDKFIALGNTRSRDDANTAGAVQNKAAADSADAQRMTQIARVYQMLFGRAPDPSGARFWLNALRAGSTPAAMAQSMIADYSEGRIVFPAALTAREYVGRLFLQGVGRAATEAELVKYSAQLPAQTRGAVAVNVVTDLINSTAGDMASSATRLLFLGKVEDSLGQMALAAKAYDSSMTTAAAAIGAVVGNGVQSLSLITPLAALSTVANGNRVLTRSANQITYDRWGNVLTVANLVDPNYKVSYTYNANNQLTAQTHSVLAGSANVPTAKTFYDALGRQVGSTDAVGNTNLQYFDSNGNLTREVHADGGEVTYKYNIFGNRMEMNQERGAGQTNLLTLYAYDHLGRMENSMNGAAVETYQFANAGNDRTFELTGGSTRLEQRFEYDELGRRVKTTHVTSNNPELELASLVSTTTRYDLSGNIVATTDALGYATLYRYNALNYRTAMKDANGTLTVWSLDDFGRAKSIVATSTGTETDSPQTYTRTYTQRYTYDAAGQKATQTASDSRISTNDIQSLTFSYKDGLLSTIEDLKTGLKTTYLYDLAGNRRSEVQTFTGPAELRPGRLQNNTLVYDKQNRLIDIIDGTSYRISYTYDNNGNRATIRTRYTAPNGSAHDYTVYNAYDAMNRQTVVNAKAAAPVATADYGDGHVITYDFIGNRLTDAYNGSTILSYSGEVQGDPDRNGADILGTSQYSKGTIERYTYDAAGRLSTTTRDAKVVSSSQVSAPATRDILIDQRFYDGLGRVVQSGVIEDQGYQRLDVVLQEVGVDGSVRRYIFDAAGRLQQQLDSIRGDTLLPGYSTDEERSLRSIYFARDEWNVHGGYDAVGNLLGYTVSPIGSAHKNNSHFATDYIYTDGYKEQRTYRVNEREFKANANTVITSHYDGNGNRTSIVDANNGTTRKFFYDADGHVQATLGTPDKFMLIANGQVLGEEEFDGKTVLGTTYQAASITAAAAPGAYVVQGAGETLQGIAQAVWGDSKLWYLIADANRLDSAAELQVGQVLRVPVRVNTVHNGADTFKPYNAADIVGSTTPAMQAPGQGGGCGGVGQIVMIVVAVAASIITAGAAMTALGPIMAGALGGAVGSVASQVVGNIIGAQDGFSWKNVALGAIGGGVAGGVTAYADFGQLGSAFKGTYSVPAAIARGALTSVITQGVGIVTGLQNGFSWRNVAASAAGSGMGAAVGGALDKSGAFAGLGQKAGEIGRGTVSGMAAGATTSILRGGKLSIVQIATDAFGNALGNSLAEANWGSGGFESNASQGSSAATFSADAAARRSNPFEGPMRDSYAFPSQDAGPDYLKNLETADLRALGQNDGSFAGSVIPRAPWDIDASLPTVFVPHVKMTFEQKLAYDLRVPASAPGQFGNDFSRGFDGTYRSVAEGPVPRGEKLGRQAAAVVDFGKGMIGLNSASTARADWQAGNYGTSVIHGAAAVGEMGTTLLSFGAVGMLRQAATASRFVATPTKTAVRELKEFGLDSAQRRSFFEGKQVLFEDPSTAFETATIFKLGPDTLHAGVYDIVSDGSGAVLSFASRSRSLANNLGVSKLELFGADIQNDQLRSLLIRRGFEPGAPVKIDSFGFDKYVDTLRKTEVIAK